MENCSKKHEPKRALIAVSFGAASPEAERSVNQLENALDIPGYDLFRAYTSQRIRERLRRERGVCVFGLQEQLEALEKAGYEEIFCQPLMVSKGMEYQKLLADLTQYASRFRLVKTGEPLLSQEKDYLAGSLLMEKMVQKQEDEAVVWMFHGREGSYSRECEKLNTLFQRKGHKDFVIGAMKGRPSFEDTYRRLVAAGYRKVVLLPFLLTVGVHVKKDLAGEHRDSWKSRFCQKGYEVRVLFKGLGEYDEICKLFCKHVEEAK